MDFVKFDKNKASTLKLDSIAFADIDKNGLFGPGLEHILVRQETFIDRRSAFEDVLPRDRAKTERTRSTGARPREGNEQQRRDRSPVRNDRSARQPSGSNNTQRQQRDNRGEKRRFWRPNPRNNARGHDNQRRDEDRGGDRARAQQQCNDQRPPYFFGAPKGRK